MRAHDFVVIDIDDIVERRRLRYNGKVPAAGEVILFDGYSFEVINVVGRRIKKVRVCRQPRAEDQDQNSE